MWNVAARSAHLLSEDYSVILFFWYFLITHDNLPDCYCFVVPFVFTARKFELPHFLNEFRRKSVGAIRNYQYAVVESRPAENEI